MYFVDFTSVPSFFTDKGIKRPSHGLVENEETAVVNI